MEQSVQTLTDRVLDIVHTKFGAPADITAATAYEEMEFDSLVLVELAVHLSELFGVDITDEEILQAGNVEETVELLARKGVQG
ncbi:acyl carrier protein [Streptomyces sodiiphilus]|uniref:Acyl carrier protein n=2 Tax=Streptomyces sodiiphilus TaxID=226217 RepID=A0ABN2P1T2_9ACTN